MINRNEITGYSFKLNEDGTYNVTIRTKDNVISSVEDSLSLRDLINWIERAL